MFTLAGERLQAIAALDVSPQEKIDRAIEAMTAFIEEHDSFPAIMLREVADRGAHLDRVTFAALGAVPRTFGAIVAEGVAAGAFRPVHPVFTYFSMVAPVVFYLAGAPIRREISDLHVADMRGPSPSAFIAHVQEAMRRTLAPS